MNYIRLDQPFALEAGGSLPGITIAYHTYGRLNADRSNVVWVCHALTANSDVARWWPGVVGEHGVVRPEDYFIVCANILGSCYGSTGPVGAGPGVGEQGVGMSGGVVAGAKVSIGPGYQVPFSDAVRNRGGIMTAAVGLITQAKQAAAIIDEGKADIVLLAREALRNPYFPIHAAKELGAAIAVPGQYGRA